MAILRAIIRRDRFINPKLGVYYSIFASAVVAAVCGCLIAEMMGLSGRMIGGILFALPVFMAGMIGAASANDTEGDFFAAGRRTPSFFAGLSLMVATLGGVGVVSITGVAARQGMDAFVLVLGWLSGLVLAAVVIAPFLRKFGAYTLPGYFGLRFESRALRMLLALVAVCVCVLIAGAELRLASEISVIMTGQSVTGYIIILAVFAGGLGALGGLRGASWMGAAQAVILLIALLVPATIVSLLISNLPLPQMTHGVLLRSSAWIERTQVIPAKVARLFEFSLSGTGLQALDARFLDMFHAVGHAAMPLGILVIGTGIASLPMLAQRIGSTPGVYDVRKAFGWAVLLTGFVLLTLLSLAGFLRGYLVQQIVGTAGDQLPLWFQSLEQMGSVATQSKSRTVTLDSVMIKRDAAIFALPIAAGMMETLVRLMQAGALAAALAAATSHIVALGTIISDDLLAGFRAESPLAKRRVGIGRIGIGIGAVVVAGAAMIIRDPLAGALAGLTLCAGACFPVLFLSILWKRISRSGAFAGVAAGTLATAGLMSLSYLGLITLPILLSASIGGPISFMVAGLVTRATAKPSRHMLHVVRDMRIPGGEAVYDRHLRLERRGKS